MTSEPDYLARVMVLRPGDLMRDDELCPVPLAEQVKNFRRDWAQDEESTMSAKIVWEDPPVQQRGRETYHMTRQALRDDPGRWAVVKDCAHPERARSLAKGFRRGAVWSGFEIVARGSKVYARFVEVTDSATGEFIAGAEDSA